MAILKDETMTAKAKMQHVASLWRAKKGNAADDVEAGIEDDEDDM
jgi:hypothetical protein